VMDRTVAVFARAVMNHAMRKTGVESTIAAMVIGGDQANLVRDRFVYEAGQGSCINAVDDARHDVALRWTAPTTIALPWPPVPPKSPRPPLPLCLFFAFPPT